MLACPACRSPFRADSNSLACTGCDADFSNSRRRPELPRCTATSCTSARCSHEFHYAILGNPRVYDFQQAHFGAQPVVSKMRAELAQVDHVTLLDIGAGTGVMAGLVSPNTRYVWLDNDTNKLRGLLSKDIDCLAVLGDATRLPIHDGSADWTLMIEVSHHISDDVLDSCLAEAARVTAPTLRLRRCDPRRPHAQQADVESRSRSLPASRAHDPQRAGAALPSRACRRLSRRESRSRAGPMCAAADA